MIDVDIVNTTYQDIITTFLLNKLLLRVGMLWIIETHEQLQYDMDKQNSEYITGGTWYIISICKKLYGKLLEGFNINARTDIYHIMYSIDAHEKDHQSYCCDSSSGGDFPLTTNPTTEAL